MTDADDAPGVGVAVSTIGRPELAELLASLSTSRRRPVAVAVANQSGRLLDVGDYPFPVTVVTSTGGASRGRNDAVAALDGAGEVLAFPNDDSRYDEGLLTEVGSAFIGPDVPAAVAVRLDEARGPRFALPPAGTPLNRRTVWRAIEPATFVRRGAFESVGGFDESLGTGAPTVWGSGEGTDLLLRVMEQGGVVLSRSDLGVLGTGERRSLDFAAYVAKHRAYARGTGHVYQCHGYPWHDRVRTLAGPLLTAHRQDDRLSLSLRLAVARLVGRAEGLSGRSLRLGPGLGRRFPS